MVIPSKTALPTEFRTLGTLRLLNVIAVASSLAALATAVFTFVAEGRLVSVGGISVWLPTFVFGLLWAVLLRSRRRFGKTSVRVGWLASVPLAAVNGGAACALWVAIPTANEASLTDIVRAAILGVTLGAICWVPSLVGTLVCFGIPIAHAQRAAERGLAGEENGERIVGIASVVMSLLALALFADFLSLGTRVDEAGRVIPAAIAVVGILTGSIAMLLAHLRAEARHEFVRAVESGDVEGYRVDASADGKVLVRIRPPAEGYRVAPTDEPLCHLDESGEATTAIEVGS